jgi:hypothetical protein
MRILIYGSTYISAVVAEHLIKQGFNLVGHVPSSNPTFPGIMPTREVSPDTPHDLVLSVQYDKKILDLKNAFNLHTGLLPNYGGCNILYHTLKNGETEQGLTFHKMTTGIDGGEIISRVTYPVLPTDTVADLYLKMVAVAPKFAELCLGICGWSGNVHKPTIYKRSDIDVVESQSDIVKIRKALSTQ